MRLCNSYDRLPALIMMARWLEDDNWLHLLGRHWSSCDNISLFRDELSNTPFGIRLGHGLIVEMMNDDDFAAYSTLPDEFFVYRGCFSNNKWGLSWSTCRETAMKFPTYLRYSQPGQEICYSGCAY
jgi:hypothetical protein